MKAIICGAGIAGLSAAWWLRNDGWQVTILERAGALRGAGYLIDFFASGYDSVERMGLLPEVRRVCYPIDGVLYRSVDGTPTSRLDAEAAYRVQHGRVVSLLRGDLERILHNALDPDTGIRFSTSVDGVTCTEDHVDVQLTDGTVERADVLIGADGLHSRVRELTFGPERRFRRDLGYHVSSYVYTDPEIAGQLGNSMHMVEAPGLQAGAYRLSDDRVGVFLAHRVNGSGELPADPRAELRRRHGELGWFVPRMLENCPEPGELYYDQMSQIEMPTWSQRRVTLIGDACQAVSLLAGQGASLAAGGAYVLAEQLRENGDVPGALQRYEERMRTAVLKKQQAGRNTADWFVPATRTKIKARNVLLRLASARGLEWMLRPVLRTPGGNVVTGA
ncbi:MAG: NAD(P)-binding protein [Pseudonocardiaceae bacterium]|nr:NAD(P)-binding protein [Pseudonocardiaceae bacterium]